MKLILALLALPTIALAEGYYYPVPANPPGYVYALPPAYTPPPVYIPPPVYVQPIQAQPFVPYQMPSTGILVPKGGTR
jgi:hypothetical protein